MVLAVLACGTSMPMAASPTATSSALQATEPVESPTPSGQEASTPAAPTPAQQASSDFTVAVIVDLQSEKVTREQAQIVAAEGSGFLSRITGIGLVMNDFVEDGAGGSTQDMASRYIGSHTVLPNGIVIFSFGDGGQSKLYGGYSYALPGPPGFRNAFASPVSGSAYLPIAVVHFSHRYAACGYGGADTPQGAVALDGECRNKPGTACVEHNGYSMCSDALTQLYSSTTTYFTASTLVHELLHAFSPGGDKDHYSTPECTHRMGYPAGFFDLQESQYYNDLCPFVYEEFGGSYQP